MIGGSTTSSVGGSFLLIPESVSIVVVTRKKIKSKKAMSAIDPAFTSGAALFAMLFVYLINFFAPANSIEPIAITARK